MKILQVFNRYFERGGEENAVRQIERMLSTRHQVETCWFHSADWSGENAPPPWKQAALMWRNPTAIRLFRDRVARFEPDLVLLHNIFPVGSAAIYPEIATLQIPAIQFIHNFRPFSVSGYLMAGDRMAPVGLRKNFWPEIRAASWQNSRLKTAWLALILTMMHRRGDFRALSGWIAISDFMREKFIEAGIQPNKIFTLRHAWQPLLETPPERDDGYYLYLGRLAAMKGVNVLLDAWDIILQQSSKAGPKLVVAGAGPLEQKVGKRGAANPLIKLRGYVDSEKKADLIHGCRAMIVPSICWEALGLAVYEAYDYAKPVLAARSGGLTETVQDNVTGRLHEPGNARQLAEQVLALDKQPEARSTMGQKGREWLLANTNEADWLARFEETVRKLKT